jgi:prepilin-type N-terminal cleavage/methylation domain-containing protein
MAMRVLHDMSGFTLIEILIATVIITVASLGVANLTVWVIRGNSFSQHLSAATTLAQERLEHIKRMSYTEIETLVGTENYGSIVNYSGYKRVTSITNNTPTTNMKTININVYWDSDKHLVNLNTIRTE